MKICNLFYSKYLKRVQCAAAVLLFLPLVLAGCAHAARDTSGFAIEDTIVVDAAFEETWQATKTVLREHEFDIYTRDKRGDFVAFTEFDRRLGLLTPERMKYSIHLEAVSGGATRISIETVKQVYGVTLLTYPDWHDRKTEDNSVALALLDAVKAKIGGQA
ncbi:MAG: hypothetical protein KJ052_04880 [Candidatus Hydrogenedentes bacterium]|nr:hypothetical protein [Candidatus Hydrogenedentota bacterium]